METVNQEMNQNETAEQPDKTFTQAEVDAIVSERLKRDRAKYADYEALKEKAVKFDEIEEAGKSELQKAIERGDALQRELESLKTANSLREMRETVAAETGVPAALLTAETEEECRKQAAAALEFAKPRSGYPQVRDAGEPKNDHKGTPKQQFADWANQVFG